MRKMRVAVILPVYNEAKCISKTLDSVLEFSINRPYYHFIFVNDGSTDQTQEILETKLAARLNGRLRVINYKNNRGKGYAVKTAVKSAYEDCICFIDSDLAYSLEQLEFLTDKLDKYDVVIGSRNLLPKSVNQINLIRRIAGQIFNTISRKILNLPFKDMQAGIKGFRNEVAKEIFEKQEMTGFSFDAELIYLAKKKGYSIGEVPVKVSEKHLSKVSKVNLFMDSVKMLIDLLKIRYNDLIGKYE